MTVETGTTTHRLDLLEAYREDEEGTVTGELQEAFALELQILQAVARKLWEEQGGWEQPIERGDESYFDRLTENMAALAGIAAMNVDIEMDSDPETAEDDIETEVELLAVMYAKRAAERIASGEDPGTVKPQVMADMHTEASDKTEGAYPRWAVRYMLAQFEEALAEHLELSRTEAMKGEGQG
jgi:hypothetical protein